MNTGNCNTGNCNTGNCNTGNWNTGDYNTGNWNTGDRNTGNWNTGNRNTGNWNTGYCNTGNRNTGNWNTGYCNTGDFNISDNETGCFCTKVHNIKIFDLETDMTFNQWRNSAAYCLLLNVNFIPTEWIRESDMSEQEKESNPEYKTTGGYLKTNDLSKVFNEWWVNLSDAEKGIITSIPNFNAEKFMQITGIDVTQEAAKVK